MTRLEEIQAQINKLMIERLSLINEENANTAKKYLGRCFKVSNNYSCPSGPDDYWTLYIKITGMSGSSLKGLLFQIDKYGKAEVEPDAYVQNSPDKAYEEITREEWDHEWVSFKEAVGRISTAVRGVVDEA